MFGLETNLKIEVFLFELFFKIFLEIKTSLFPGEQMDCCEEN